MGIGRQTPFRSGNFHFAHQLDGTLAASLAVKADMHLEHFLNLKANGIAGI